MTYTADSLILGAPAATPEQCAALIRARPHGEYTEKDVRKIIDGYFAVCAGVGMDVVLAIAQMCHETGYLSSAWAARPFRNPAGIGVTGRHLPVLPNHPDAAPPGAWARRDGVWHEGCSFAAWLPGVGYVSSVEAHVGRLLAYALTDAQANDAQHTLIVRALSVHDLSFRHRGRAPSLRGLAGRWAVPGDLYPQKISTIANAIVTLRA